MSRWRVAFDRIGGPDAVTWPAFWITYASNLTAHLTTGGAVNASIAVRLVIVTVAQIVAFIPLLVMRWTVLRRPSRPKPWIAVGGFAFAAVLRAVVLTALLVGVGAVSEPLWGYRIVASLQNTMVLLIIVALVVSAMRAHARTLQGLIQVQHDLLKTEEELVKDVTTRNEQVIVQVQERLRTELATLDTVDGAASVVELQRLASDIVRPMSHELATSLPNIPDVLPSLDDAHVTWKQAVMGLIDRPPLRPFLAALYMAWILSSTAWSVFGVTRGLAMSAVAFVSVMTGSWVANWILGPLLQRLVAPASLVATLISGLLVGFTSAGAISLLDPPGAVRVIFIFGGGVFITGVVLLTAFVTAVLRRQRNTELELIDSTEKLQFQLVRLRQAQWLQRQALARALHGPVQAAVTAAALRLDAAVRSGGTGAELLENARHTLLAAVDVLDTADSTDYNLDVALERISGTWEGLCEITSQVDILAATAMAEDAIASAVVIDLMSEAVSNAVRHGEAKNIFISISIAEHQLLTLTIRDDGNSESNTRPPGLGTALLDDCTMKWTRDIASTGTTLSADVPTSAVTIPNKSEGAH